MSSKIHPFKHSEHNSQIPAELSLKQVDVAKRREYLLKVLGYTGNEVISLQQLEQQFKTIVDFDGI